MFFPLIVATEITKIKDTEIKTMRKRLCTLSKPIDTSFWISSSEGTESCNQMDKILYIYI